METTNETNEPALEWEDCGDGVWKGRIAGWRQPSTVALIHPHPGHPSTSILTSAFLPDEEDGEIAGQVAVLKRVAGEALVRFAAEFAGRFLLAGPAASSDGAALEVCRRLVEQWESDDAVFVGCVEDARAALAAASEAFSEPILFTAP